MGSRRSDTIRRMARDACVASLWVSAESSSKYCEYSTAAIWCSTERKPEKSSFLWRDDAVEGDT